MNTGVWKNGFRARAFAEPRNDARGSGRIGSPNPEEASMIEIKARQGKALRLRRGQKARVVNSKGQQVVDTWAFNAADLTEFMSMEHSRVAIGRIIPGTGDA